MLDPVSATGHEGLSKSLHRVRRYRAAVSLAKKAGRIAWSSSSTASGRPPLVVAVGRLGLSEGDSSFTRQALCLCQSLATLNQPSLVWLKKHASLRYCLSIPALLSA